MEDISAWMLLREDLGESPVFRRAAETLMKGKGPLSLRAAETLAAPLLAAMAERSCRVVFAVVAGVEGAEDLQEELEDMLGEERALLLPPRPHPPGGGEAVDEEGSAARARTLFLLGEWRGGRLPGPPVLLIPAAALPGPLPEGWKELRPLLLRRGSEADLSGVAESLASLGYRREYQVEAPGQFAVRGGILDIFAPTRRLPVRALFDGDELVGLREFDPQTQRSLPGREDLDELKVFPLREGPAEGERETVHALRDEGDLLVLLEPRVIRDRLQGLEEEGALALLEEWMRGSRALFLDPWSADAPLELASRRSPAYRGDLEIFLQDVKQWLQEGWRVILAFETAGRMQRVGELLQEEEMAPLSPPLPGSGVALTLSRLHHGFVLPDAGLAVVTEEDLFGELPRRRHEPGAAAGTPLDRLDFREGDHVVHLHHGIGVFDGLTVREVAGARREYLVIRYAEGDVLYLPTERISLVHRYVGAENPTVHRLAGSQWRKARKRAREAVRDVAADLLRLYAERQASGGFAFSPDSPWQREMEASFPFPETPDQLKAIREVKEDMERPVPMDRLVYGDVGYGKTEVALRAAFKAVMDGKQVAVLVPTTVLALQHGETFRQRFSAWPVRVEVLSRFRSRREQQEVLEGLAQGRVDVVIGTHRLLQGDVAFADLGLVVVDEEHRFGVMHKERLKQLRRTVDVLTLTATPIPRTLQMSLSGLRDMSVIDTPIEDRRSVQTFVGLYNEGLVLESIRRELDRDGQVFYLYNLVEGIEAVAERLRRMLPRARVGVGHGRMPERELEKVALDFVEGRLDVLVCTTIIESGLDIPNANTLIVEGAERLGLAQLYHLRGRIGRSRRQAYAYFLFREGARLTDAAFQRLRVIRDFTELGSGLRVALQDLEIRGAGNLLGPQQHGHVEAVGFELYCRMLQEAVESLRGERRRRRLQVTLDLPLPAFLPRDYIERSSRRVEIYRRMVEAIDAEGLEELREEVADRYGPPPRPVLNLFEVARLRLACEELGIREMNWTKGRLFLRSGEAVRLFRDLGLLDVRGILASAAGEVRCNPATREVSIRLDGGFWQEEGCLERLLELLERLRENMRE